MSTAAERYFAEAWLRCAEEGWCDALGGQEYSRVLAAWGAADMPYDVVDWILCRANEAPAPKGDDK
jgi:hypothetical protein